MENKKKKVIRYALDEENRLGVTAVSLVDFPAIEENFVALRAADVIKLSADEEQKMLYGPALIPEKEILRIDAQGEEYFIVFPRDVVKQVAHQFLKKNLHHNATLDHTFSVTGCAVVESWIKEGTSDKSDKFGYDCPEGTWFIGMKVDDDSIWSQVKDGTFKGFSIEGMFQEAGVDLMSENVDKMIEELERTLEELD